MATRSEENRRKQQQLVNAGYKGVVVDGSWGPYQQKLWLHYLANSLGPTKQQRIDRAKQNNQREAQIARNYFSQTPSIRNLARGVYHWWNSIPALGGQNESGVQEYNVASNPIVAAASPGGGIAKTGQLAKTAKEGYTRGKRLFGFLGRKNTISGNPRQTAFGRTLVDNAEDAEILTDAPLTSKEAIEVSRNVAKKIWDEMWVNNRFPKIINPKKAEEAKKIATETPKQPADSKIPEAVNEAPIEIPRAPVYTETPKQPEVPKQPETPPVNNEVRNQAPQNTSKKGFDWGYYLGFGSFKPEGGFGNKASTTGKWLLNATKLGGAYHIPAYIYDSHVQNNRRAEAEAQGKEYIETPTWAWDISPMGIMQNIIKSDIKQGQKYYKQKTKAPVEDDWLKQLDEAGKNVGY